jgi:chromosome segregation protein
MFLKRLEIVGFKSFVQKARLDFSLNEQNKKNITAIVGPNGSGKSNLADALRWVLGEQSPKLLRIKKTEDIIFAGLGNRSRVGTAFVSVVLDNESGRIPLDYKEIIISRKFSRNGESEYLINKKKARLADIVELTIQAGIGRRGYSVIGQGMADSILSASPSERKAILEEAAGVKQYQFKKEQGLKKLEATKRNLIRVSDLLNEVAPRLRSLKRQAGKAKRKEEIEKELRTKQNQWYGFYWKNLAEQYSKLTQEEDKIKKQIFQAGEETEKAEKKIQEEKEKNKDSRQMDSKFSQDLEILFNRRNNLQKELAINEGRLEARKEIEIFAEEEKDSSNQVPASVDLNFIKEQLEKLDSDYEIFLILFKKAEEEKNWSKAKSFLNKIGEGLKKIVKEINPVKNAEISGEAKLRQRQNIEKKQENLKAEHLQKELKDKIRQMQNDLENKENEIKKLQAKISQTNEKERETRERFFDFESEFRQKQNELEKIKDELRTIEIGKAKIEANRENLADEIKKELGSLNCLEHYEKNKNSEFNVEKLKREIEKLKAEFFTVGGIDPMVIREYEETEERYNFLSGQLKDLENASDSLKRIVAELEDKIESLFSEAFREINKEFNKYFRIIFSGGMARLQLSKIVNNSEKETDSSDGINSQNKERADDAQPLQNFDELEKKRKDSGVEIIAVPPGKKVRDLTMLSGGERALASIALLFAIISHNPPPFSMLDEVDAALDEANTRRFAKILKELSQKTQFIVITHNRETMRQASTLYGITTGGDGISKILSVKLDDVKKDGKVEKA